MCSEASGAEASKCGLIRVWCEQRSERKKLIDGRAERVMLEQHVVRRPHAYWVDDDRRCFRGAVR